MGHSAKPAVCSVLVALAFLVAGPWESSAQTSDSTRWVPFRGDALEAFATELFSSAGVRDPSAAASRLLKLARDLRSGDEAQLHFLGHHDGSLAFFHVDLSADDFLTWARVRASGPVLDAAAQVLREHWLRTLLPIEERLHFSVEEVQPAPGSDPEFAFFLRTEREYGCLGYRIEGDLAREKGVIRLVLLGISPPNGICATSMGPARFYKGLAIDVGRYEVWITHEDRTDGYELVITDSGVRLAPPDHLDPGFTEGDTRLKLRRPPQSLAFYCGTTQIATHLCREVREWLLALEGIQPLDFPAEGVVPYRRGIGTHHAERYYFRYADNELLEHIAECFSKIDGQLRDTVGNSLTIEPWYGPRFHAWSGRSSHEPHIQAPENVASVCGND